LSQHYLCFQYSIQKAKKGKKKININEPLKKCCFFTHVFRLKSVIEAIPDEDDFVEMKEKLIVAMATCENRLDEAAVRGLDDIVGKCAEFKFTAVVHLMRFMKSLSHVACDDADFFAQFCAESAVIDQRVAELQLTRCRNVAFRECVGKLFGAGERVRQVLVDTSVVATAVKRKLVSLLTDPTIGADRFAQHVRLAQLTESDGVDERIWSIVMVFFVSLAHARRCGGASQSNLHPSTVNESFLIPWIGARMSLKQPLFTLDQQASLEKLYASESAHIALASVCKATGGDGVHRPPSVVARDAGGVPHFVAESDATNVPGESSTTRVYVAMHCRFAQ
jgi:hypothetical protein